MPAGSSSTISSARPATRAPTRSRSARWAKASPNRRPKRWLSSSPGRSSRRPAPSATRTRSAPPASASSARPSSNSGLSVGEAGEAERAQQVNPRILVVDNYDSFTWNLVHYLREIGAEVRVERNDALTAAEALASGADGLLISPGPGTPDEAGISLGVVAACAAAGRPLLGVCLGHQAIGRHFGGCVD